VGNMPVHPQKSEICGSLPHSQNCCLPAMSSASEPVTEPPHSIAPPRRKNYSEDDDVALLRQVLLDRPFAKPRGKVVSSRCRM
jgi:hypothetical protein